MKREKVIREEEANEIQLSLAQNELEGNEA